MRWWAWCLGLLVFLVPAIVRADCVREGKLCDDVKLACCQPPDSPYRLWCPPRGTPDETGRHCRRDARSSATTTTTRPTTTATTVPPRKMVRFSPCYLGLRYPHADERKVDPRTGRPANQYLAGVRVEQAIHEMLPRALRAIRDTPACATALSGLAANVDDEIPGRLFYRYGLRALRSGNSYPFTLANYNWEGPQRVLRRLERCAPDAALTPELRQLLNRPGAGCEPLLPALPGSMSDAGLLEPSKPGPSLTWVQCQRLEDARRAHHAHGAALLAGDMAEAINLARVVGTTQEAFEESATTIGQQALFTLIFSPDVDPRRTTTSIDNLTRETMRAYDQWVEAFGCGTGRPPNVERVVSGRWAHGRVHFLRAVSLPGMVLTEICEGDVHYCLSSEE